MNVTPITRPVLGGDDPLTHCVTLQLAASDAVVESSLIARHGHAHLQFVALPGVAARVGVFAVTIGPVTRSFILLLPAVARPQRVLFAILPAIDQASDYYLRLHGHDPRSPELIRDTLAMFNGDDRLGKVNPSYGTQIMTAGRPRAVLVPVRILTRRDEELGVFVAKAPAMGDAARAIAAATGGAFDAEEFEVLTHSNGVMECNRFLASARGAGIDIRHGISLDPYHAIPLVRPPMMVARQYLSGHTGGISHGRPHGDFTYLPFDCWRQEPERARVMARWRSEFDHLHNYAFPKYLLRAALRSMSI